MILVVGEFKGAVHVENRERARFMAADSFHRGDRLLRSTGVLCEKAGLRLGLLFRLIPEGSHSTVISALGVIAIFGSVVGLVELIKIW
jgi:hypothetical protein